MSDDQSIIIKRLNKCPHVAHGGAWKIAFADFMTATAAFFLMLWILGGTNDEEMKAMAEFFRDPTVVESSPMTLVESKEAGRTSDAMIDMGGFKDSPKGEEGDEDGSGKAQEKAQMEAMKLELEQKISENESLNELKEQLKIEVTPNGLQVQILDDRKRPMFGSGVDLPKEYASKLLREVGKVLSSTNNKISIAGHTDSSGYHDSSEYTNWELSADRANAARRLLLDGGVNSDRIAQAVGMADTVPFDKENPYNPRNRRISIIVLNKEAEERLRSLSDAPDVENLSQQLQLTPY
ncbi:flagellar motor protein MotB [Thiomicrorhabdus lithotrophica]|uniref:Flagellar motor protein MotB n=1 Tax=Thiomicrorhabdus lithotrophica TaxID=2949997 RepID=A0ABY8CBL9_9GAMM|nr:flagellar motor protein MotB [Thiomicrorhabdus lithotrophica]WEJ63385.1 flagellar motor protein MotB [Thiomicrorhabdus lithotrophica]